MSKLSFRARALDATKPMPIYMAEELPDLPDYSAINRAVPQMPSGMEKEEECEHHLQRAICAGLIIPTPEVSELPDRDFYDRMYPADYKQPRQLIHMQPFTMEQDIPDYDMDTEDERWLVQTQALRPALTPLKFEEMMDRLEKNSGQTVVPLHEAKALLQEDDDLTVAVFDYWLNKRLKHQQPLILTVRTEQRPGVAAGSPYLAFRRRTEKMQTRKNRKNDETSYEKMLKLRRDLNRAVTLLELVKKRERMKRDHVRLTVEVFEKRFQARDFTGAVFAEATAAQRASTRPAFTPIFHNHGYSNQGWTQKAMLRDDGMPRNKEKRQYKKRKHKPPSSSSRGAAGGAASAAADLAAGLGVSSDEEAAGVQASPAVPDEPVEDEGMFAFRRNKLCSYHMPLSEEGNWSWYSMAERGLSDRRFRFTLTSLAHPRRRCIGFARRRLGRGGRVILDRVATDHDDLWRQLDFSVVEPRRRPEVPPPPTLLKLEPQETEEEEEDRKDAEVLRACATEGDVGGGDVSRNFGGGAVVKSEVWPFDDGGRTNDDGAGMMFGKSEVASAAVGREEEDEMVEMLRSVRRDWLHFRPKTPPPGSAEDPAACTLLPESDTYLTAADTSTPFSIEVQTLEAPSALLLDTSVFLSSPFSSALDGMSSPSPASSVSEEVPVTDTRQQSSSASTLNLNVNVGLSNTTLTATPPATTSSLSSSSSVVTNDSVFTSTRSNHRDGGPGGDNSDGVCDSLSTFGCSRFRLVDSGVSAVAGEMTAARLATPKSCGGADRQKQGRTGVHANNTNGLLSQFVLDGRTKNQLSYAYSGGVGYPNASSGTLSLHTSAHTLTLNSHSANILEIPLADEPEPVATKLGGATGEQVAAVAPNNKTKAIVRKNNLVMEVT